MRAAIMLVLAALALAACESPAAPDAGADGGADDACTSDLECPGALVCESGICQREGCTPGSEACACAAGDRCGRGADGDPLVCMEGVCSSMTCPAGTHGCVCVDGEVCRGEGDECRGGYCVGSDCLPGDEGCACVAGTCEANLYCLDGAICVDDDGYEGGPCLPTGRCHAGTRCDATLDVCVSCDPGTQGCSCERSSCNSGLACLAGICIDSRGLPPADPQCYTPCRESLDEGGSVRRCDADGLMDGCVGGLSCLEGSCVADGESAPACSSDLDCPFFQTCLVGRCYSNCETSADCPSGLGCHQRVCRVPCESTAGAATCGTGYFCDAGDGENGYCVQLAGRSSSAPGATSGAGGFALDRASLELSNVRTSGEVQVAVDDAARREHTFTIRRLSHVVTRRDGSVERVEAARDASTGELLGCDAARGECPLSWLDIGATGTAASRDAEVSFRGAGGCAAGGTCPVVTIANAAGVEATRWQGTLEIAGNGGRTTVTLTYVERADGRWSGTMHYFGTFPTGGIDAWRARSDRSDVTGVQNGLVTRWAAFRRGNLPGGWEEMKAVLTSTETESWAFASVADRCPASNGACYPYTNASGVRVYVSSLAATPIPRGTTELPFAMSVRQSGLEPTELEGRVESSASLHYPGNPAVSLTFAASPADARACSSSVTTDCVVFMGSVDVTSIVGGRYPSPDGRCERGYQAVAEPWLVGGFTAGTSADGTGGRYRTWCVDAELPYGTASTAAVAANRSLAGGNPVPDGIPRRRTLRLLDGALVNQREMFFLFEETFDTFVDAGSTSVSSYGYVLLSRQPADLDDADEDGDGIADVYQGTPAPTIARTAPTQRGMTCDPALVRDILGGATGDPASLTPTELDRLTEALLEGSDPSSGSVIDGREVHYYCEDTGLFDGGPNDDGSASAVRIACPTGSRVVFFTTRARTQAQIAAERCQSAVTCTPDGCSGGTCQTTLNLWMRDGVVDVYEPFYRCDPVGGVETPYCDDDRLDLRRGKTFYRPAVSTSRTFVPLQAEIESAFRYRTRFTSASGTRPGFAPQICIPSSDRIPYCYDPPSIEEIRDRVDCLVAIYADDTLIASLSSDRRNALQTFLRGDFAQFDGTGRDGFERLYSELLVMMGDEALTQAFASRFDLAAAGGASFEGSLFEPGGIDLSGVAGYEMVSLYRAVQLYQMALDRLYALGPDLTEALSRNESVDSSLVFVSAETVTLHLERLIRASTQRARAYSEIARRYQLMNRSDLARSVVQRAYISAYLEAVVLVQLMYAIADRSTRADRPQIELTVTQALRRYRLALLDMRDLYGSITDDIDYFGFAPDFVPFPPLDESARGRNAFEVMFDIVQARVSFARSREDQALASNRSFQTDTAQFQAELVRLRTTYEGQLAQLCGNFAASDGRVYPAIRTYASLSRYPEQLGDPCGRLGNGQIHDAMVAVQQATTQQDILETRLRNLFEEVAIEENRVRAQCDLIDDVATFQYERAGESYTLQEDIARTRLVADIMRQGTTAIADAVSAAVCVPAPADLGAQCANEAADAAIRGIAAIANIETTQISEQEVIRLQRELAAIDRRTAAWVTRTQCTAAQIDSNARTATLLLGVRELELEMIRNYRDVRLQLSEVGRLLGEAQRLQSELEESEELTISIEAARNDPNVRVYRNDAVLNADIAFQDALRAAYRLTRIFEYYTSQSYARLDELFLIRMVGAGDYNIENYLLALQNAFIDFEEAQGSPDSRVIVLSMRDDVMQIPRLDERGRALSETERIARMRSRLADVDLLDGNGYLVLPFRTDLAALSPLTRNHKISYIEAEIVGSSVGDTVGRVYVRPTGTGVIRGIDGELDYYVLPQRTAVVNTFFNGNRVFSPEVYRAERLRDRPLVNTEWELVINQRDELVNADIDLQSLSDIRLIVYYEDFTVF